jgi:hypothetical protein
VVFVLTAADNLQSNLIGSYIRLRTLLRLP